MTRAALKPGDRVSVSGWTPRGSEIDHFYGTVEKRLKGGWLKVRWDCQDWVDRVERVHSWQCRRLVKRKPRE